MYLPFFLRAGYLWSFLVRYVNANHSDRLPVSLNIQRVRATRCVLHMSVSKKLHKYGSRSKREVNLDFDIRTSSRWCNVESQTIESLSGYSHILSLTGPTIFINLSLITFWNFNTIFGKSSSDKCITRQYNDIQIAILFL